MIPMYDAFVAYIRILWNEVRPHLTVTRTVYDFVLHRAAYLFVTTDLRSKTSVPWSCPATLVKHVADSRTAKSKISFGGTMATKIAIAYIQLGLGWDENSLSNEQTFKAEIEYVACRRATLGETIDIRHALFPSHFS